MSESIPALDPFQTQLDKLLNEVSVLAIRLRQDARRVQAVSDLPTGGGNVLRMLSRSGTLTVPQMARLDSTSRQNIQILVNRLEREGCVESVPNPAHKRSDLIRITDRGMASIDTVSRNEDSYKDKLGLTISAEELTRAAALLRQIREALCATTPINDQAISQGAVMRPAESLSRKREVYSEPKPKEQPPETVQLKTTLSEENELPVSLL